jgi:hypothetical protein
MQMRRLTRPTNAFSKKWKTLWAVLCLHFAMVQFLPHSSHVAHSAYNGSWNLGTRIGQYRNYLPESKAASCRIRSRSEKWNQCLLSKTDINIRLPEFKGIAVSIKTAINRVVSGCYSRVAWFLVVLLLPAVGSSTEIIVRIVGNVIYVAADSKASIQNSDGTIVRSFATCKIDGLGGEESTSLILGGEASRSTTSGR